MAKVKACYTCQSCAYTSAKWLGRCPSCEAWSSFKEEIDLPQGSEGSLAGIREDFNSIQYHGAELSRHRSPWVELDDPSTVDSTQSVRLSTGLSELDRVLGGGLVSDSFILLGGDPGIGKSTLLLQMAKGLRETQPHLKILYVSGEESVEQIRGRAKRLGVKGKGQFFLAAETQLEKVFASVKELRPHLLMMDSLQTFSSDSSQSAPGSVSQVREIAARLMTLAKSAGICVWLVGHVTKEGSIAGPKTVEHMVDTVLYFEGEGGQNYRLLRTVKNRFGSTRELGVFEMDGEGLKEVTNPSSLFLSERKEPISGTAVSVPLEGSRPLLVELQALVTASGLAVPRRTSVGMDSSRISLLAAILEKHMKLPLAEQDLFFNVAGGLKLVDPACDLAAAVAIWSSSQEKAIPLGWVFMGELGLTGEVRRISQPDLRIEEAKRLGYKTLVLPQMVSSPATERLLKGPGMRALYLNRIEELPALFS